MIFIDDYRLQPEVIHLQVGGESLECDNDDNFVFADVVVARIINGKLQGLERTRFLYQKAKKLLSNRD